MRFSTEERGEGVVSVAIAILVIAFLGVTLFVVFDGVLESVGTTAQSQIERIGSGG